MPFRANLAQARRLLVQNSKASANSPITPEDMAISTSDPQLPTPHSHGNRPCEPEHASMETSEAMTRAIVDGAVDGIITIDQQGIIASCNPSALSMFGYVPAELIGQNVSCLIPQAYAADHDRHLADYVRTGEKKIIGVGRELVGQKKDGTTFPIKLAVSEVRVGDRRLFAGIVHDLTERDRLQSQLRGRNRVLEKLAKGQSLEEVLGDLIEIGEESRPDMIGSVHVLDQRTGCLRFGASRRLPDFYVEAIEGVVPGQNVGSCGTSAFTGQRVIVEDINTDPLWEDYRDLAARANLRACWSEPILDSCERVVGTFAIYYSEPRTPDATDLDFVQDSAKLAAIAIERVRSDDMLRQMAAIVDSTEDAIILKNLDGVIEKWNEGAEHLYGFSGDEAVGQSIKMLVPDDRIYELEASAERLRQGERVERFETVRLTKDGRRIHVSTSISPVRDSAGNLSHFVEIQNDISQRKHSEAINRESERKLSTLLNNLPGAAFRLANDDAFTFEFVSNGCLEVFGYTASELTCARMVILPKDMPEFSATIARCLEEHQSFDYVHRIRHRNGEIRWVWPKGQGVYGDDGEFLAIEGFISDVTELHESRERLVQSGRLAAVGQMISAIAHESRNALQRIQVGTDMLGLEIGDDSDVHDDLQRINRAKDDLLHLFEDLRTYAAPIQLDTGPRNIAEVWQQAWTNLEVSRAGRDAELVEETCDTDLICCFDAFRFQQVFRNLFENALAASSDPVRISVSCEDSEIDGAPAVRIKVRDNGPGLTDEQKERIFEAFFTTKSKGTGLGMAIAQRIVQAHRGSILVGDAKDGGAEFLVSLPRTSQ